jgi:hypothetical protein
MWRVGRALSTIVIVADGLLMGPILVCHYFLPLLQSILSLN